MKNLFFVSMLVFVIILCFPNYSISQVEIYELSANLKEITKESTIYDQMDVETDMEIFTKRESIKELIKDFTNDFESCYNKFSYNKLKDFGKSETINELVSISKKFNQIIVAAPINEAYSREWINEYFSLLTTEEAVGFITTIAPNDYRHDFATILRRVLDTKWLIRDEKIYKAASQINNQYAARVFITIAKKDLGDIQFYLLCSGIDNKYAAKAFIALAEKRYRNISKYCAATKIRDSDQEKYFKFKNLVDKHILVDESFEIGLDVSDECRKELRPQN